VKILWIWEVVYEAGTRVPCSQCGVPQTLFGHVNVVDVDIGVIRDADSLPDGGIERIRCIVDWDNDVRIVAGCSSVTACTAIAAGPVDMR
jgi:hypothetical protein